MSRAADIEAERRLKLLAAFPADAVAQLVSLPEFRVEDAANPEMLPRIMLGSLHDDSLIDADGRLTPRGVETLKALSALYPLADG